GKQHRDDGGANSPDAVVFGAYGEHREVWGNDELVVLHSYQRYLLQVAFVDHLLGRLIHHLKSIDLYDRCLFVVTADHGVSFRADRSRRIPIKSNVADIMAVPLFIKLPHQHMGAINDRNVATIDVLPTIADVLKISPPFPYDGHSVFDPAEPEPPEKVFYN